MILKERIDEGEALLRNYNIQVAASKSNDEVENKQGANLQDNCKHATTGSTASFDYMLGPEKLVSSSFYQQEQGVTKSTTTFFGFQYNITTQKGDESSQQQFKTNHSKLNIDINQPFLTDEDQALTEKGQTDWARYLDEPRKKYFFYSDDTPTLRLFETMMIVVMKSWSPNCGVLWAWTQRHMTTKLRVQRKTVLLTALNKGTILSQK